MSDVTLKTNVPTTYDLLGILFVAFKLAGVIGWSWWWVLAPWWIPAIFSVTLGGYILIRNRKNKGVIAAREELKKQILRHGGIARKDWN